MTQETTTPTEVTAGTLDFIRSFIVLGITSGREDLLNDALQKLEDQIELLDPDWREPSPGHIKIVEPGYRF